MICVPISRNSRGSSALTLPCVPTDMKTGVSTTPCGVVNRPRRALEVASDFNNSNIGQVPRGRQKPSSLQRRDRFQRQVHPCSLASRFDLECALLLYHKL